MGPSQILGLCTSLVTADVSNSPSVGAGIQVLRSAEAQFQPRLTVPTVPPPVHSEAAGSARASVVQTSHSFSQRIQGGLCVGLASG